ncbi:hypothetical protein GQ457_02G043000 [Hibiscus cannabinus]
MTIKMFEVSISNLLPHMIKGQYMVLDPMKMSTNPDWSFYKDCRQLMEEIKNLASDGILRRELIEQWGKL